MAGIKAMQSIMGEEIQRIKEALGQVSCHHQPVAGLRQQPVTSLCSGGSAASGHTRSMESATHSAQLSGGADRGAGRGPAGPQGPSPEVSPPPPLSLRPQISARISIRRSMR